MALVIGQEFCSFEELAKSIQEWEKKNFVTLYTRSSRSVEAARRRAPNRTFLDQLKFSELDYACVHGGREYKSKATESRPCQKTFLKDCPFVIKVRMRKRGRLKGAGLTVIGLPKKKGKTASRPTAFLLRSEWEKTILILDWFVDPEVSERVTRGGELIEEDEVECRPEKIPRKCLDDNVCVGQIRKYFTFDAWNLLEATMDTMRTQGSWICSVCQTDLHSMESICCDGCLDWVHLKCTGLKRAPKSKHWFCRACYSM